MGLVGLKTVQHLHEQFGPREVARIAAADFFRIAGVKVAGGVVTPPPVPTSTFFAFRPPSTQHDVMLFIGEEQPINGKEYEFARLVIDVAEHFGVTRIFTAAAMVTSLHHGEPSRVHVAATQAELIAALPAEAAQVVDDGHIGGLNGLLLGAAQERGIDGYCFLGEIPYYITNLENPRAAAVVVQLLGRILHFDVDVTDLQTKAAYVEAQVEQAVRKARADATKSLAGGDDETVETNEDGAGSKDHGAIN